MIKTDIQFIELTEEQQKHISWIFLNGGFKFGLRTLRAVFPNSSIRTIGGIIKLYFQDDLEMFKSNFKKSIDSL